MEDFINIIDKIKVVLRDGVKRKVTDKEVSLALDMSVQNFSNYKNDDRIPLENILNFCAKKRISINWLLYSQMPCSLENETMKHVGVKYAFDINASCGGGAINYDDAEYEVIMFPWYMLSHIEAKNDKYDHIHIINIVGDSMEPELSDNDKVFVDTSKKELNKKSIFVVCTTDGVYVKRVEINEDKQVVLKSSNPAYKDIIVDGEVSIIGQVIDKVY